MKKEYDNLLNEFKNFKINNIDLITYETTIKGIVEQIWKGPKLDVYVDHGLEHSYRIIDILFLKNDSIDSYLKKYSTTKESFSLLEKFILLISAYIHDIGMQYLKYEKIQNIKEDINNYIRNNHCELGFALYKKHIYNVIENSVKGCPDLNELFVRIIPTIAFAHCSSIDNEYWNEIIEKWMQYDILDKQNVRYHLITSLFRIADELDTTKDRIIKDNLRLFSSSLELDNKIHWLSCLFIDDIELNIQVTGREELRGINKPIYINLIRYKHKEHDDIVKKLLIRKEKKIKEECEKINKIFTNYPLGLYFQFKDIKPSQHIIYDNMPDDVLGYFKPRVLTYGRSSSLTNSRNISMPNFLEIYISNEFEILDNKINEIFNNFIFNAKINPGNHINYYFDLKEFIESPILSNSLVYLLKEYFNDKSIDIIIGIGSFGVSIGSLLSLILKKDFIYIEKGNYNNLNFIINNFKNLLIIDNILSETVEIKTLLNEIYKKFKNSPTIYLFIIYLLHKNREIYLNFQNLNIVYLYKYEEI